MVNIFKNNEDFSKFDNLLESPYKVHPHREAFKIALAYGMVGAIWILLSDEILSRIINNHQIYKKIEVYKGWFYVFATMLMVYILIRNRLILLESAMKKVYEGYGELVSLEEEIKQQFEELEKHRDALFLSEQRYELVVEGAHDGIWDWDIKNNIHYLSSRWKKHFGYDDEELRNKIETWIDLIHSEDKEEALKKVESYMSSRSGLYKNTYRLRCKDGSYRWVLSKGKAIWNKEGEAIRFAGSHTDITNQIELEEHLREEKEFSDSIINDSSVIIIVWDVLGRVMRFNPFAEKVTGYREKEVIGKNWVDILIPIEKRDEIKKIIEKIKRGKVIRNIEKQLICKDGSYINVLFNNNILYSENGDIIGIVSTGTDITERKAFEEKLHNLAYYDALTSLPNRSMFELKINNLLKERENKTSNFALIYMDIDNFKHINDTLGHISGDLLLKYVSNILKLQIKSPDFVARLSGDEFVIIFEDIIDKNHVINKIEGLLKKLRTPWVLEKQEFFISFSMGVALYPDHGKSLSTLLKNADTAMFTVKKNMKDNYCFYTDEMQEKTLAYISMVNQLRRAIIDEEFTLFYQPQIDLNTSKIIGVEALIRWIHPKRGIISPMEFIPLAEETGYIHQIGRWVIKTAFKQKKQWEQKGYNPIKMSINLSGKRVTSDSVVKEIKEILESLNMDTSDIQIEITETAVMEDLEAAVEVLKQLRNMGIKIALDDFGTGYSSLTYLKNLPIDIVKMDREFIKSIIDENEDDIIVKSVIRLTHSLNLKVVAEGIETEKQLAFLKKCNCDIGQGYLFSKPVPQEEIEKILKIN